MVTAVPASSIVPSSGGCAPDRIFRRVDLPAPFSPRSAWISPGATSKSTLSRAITPGKRLLIPAMRSKGRVIGTCSWRRALPARLPKRTQKSALRAQDSDLAHRERVEANEARCPGSAPSRLLHLVQPFGLVEVILGDGNRSEQGYLSAGVLPSRRNDTRASKAPLDDRPASVDRCRHVTVADLLQGLGEGIEADQHDLADEIALLQYFGGCPTPFHRSPH